MRPFILFILLVHVVFGNIPRSDNSYDEQNRLIKVETPDKTIEYSYDAEGNRITKTIDGIDTSYTLLAPTLYSQGT